MKILPLLACMLVSLIHATPPTPIPNEQFIRIKVWGDVKVCEPEFEYRIDDKGIKVYFGNMHIESRKDAISVFQTVKALRNDLKILENQPLTCFNDGNPEAGLSITYRGDVFRISRDILSCKKISPKTQTKLLKIIDGFIMMDAEFEERRTEPGNMALISKCHQQ